MAETFTDSEMQRLGEGALLEAPSLLGIACLGLRARAVVRDAFPGAGARSPTTTIMIIIIIMLCIVSNLTINLVLILCIVVDAYL